MRLTLCRLTFHENLFLCNAEVGRLYETGRYLHNYSLIMRRIGSITIFPAQQIPNYAQELE
jgi:CRISPR-associated protein Csc1